MQVLKLSEKTKEDSTKFDKEPVETKVNRELDNTMLAKCNLKLDERMAEWLAEYHDGEERGLVKSNVRLAKCNLKLAEHHNDDDESELVERNARVGKCNFKLAERLDEYCRF